MGRMFDVWLYVIILVVGAILVSVYGGDLSGVMEYISAISLAYIAVALLRITLKLESKK